MGSVKGSVKDDNSMISPSQRDVELSQKSKRSEKPKSAAVAKFTVIPDKFGTKVSDTPFASYDIEKADKLTRQKVQVVKFTEPLNLYKKEESIYPEPYDIHKPFGSSVKGLVDMGSKYKEKYEKCGVTPRGLDYDKIAALQQKKVPAVSFGKVVKMTKKDLGESYQSIPTKSVMKQMTREEKIAMIN